MPHTDAGGRCDGKGGAEGGEESFSGRQSDEGFPARGVL